MIRIDTIDDLITCCGGPYDGMVLSLKSPGTLEFKFGNFKGYYDQ